MDVVWEIVDDLLWEAADKEVDNAFRYGCGISDRNKSRRHLTSFSVLELIFRIVPRNECSSMKMW